jgi:RNA polymerase sigma-70 factor (ECF subfamily)
MTPIVDQTVNWPNVIARAREGCDSSLGIIAQNVHHYLLATAAARMGSDMLAKFGASDIVQISLLEARSAIRGFRGSTEAEIRLWLRMIVINTLTDETRRYVDVKARDVKLEVGLHQDSIPLACQSKTASWVVSRRERDVELADAVNRLPPRLRRVIEARYRDGLDYDQIACELGCTPSATRSAYARALKQLRIWLEPSQ